MEKALKTMTLDFLGAAKHKISLEKIFETENILFLDLRTNEEMKLLKFNLDLFKIQVLEIPVDELPERINELPQNKLITCFCSSGTRSAWAYIYLFSKGYNVKWIEGGNEELVKLLKPGKIVKKYS